MDSKWRRWANATNGGSLLNDVEQANAKHGHNQTDQPAERPIPSTPAPHMPHLYSPSLLQQIHPLPEAIQVHCGRLNRPCDTVPRTPHRCSAGAAAQVPPQLTQPRRVEVATQRLIRGANNVFGDDQIVQSN